MSPHHSLSSCLPKGAQRPGHHLHPAPLQHGSPSESPQGSAGLTAHGPHPLAPPGPAAQPAAGRSLAPNRRLLGALQAGPALCTLLFAQFSRTHSVAALRPPPSPCSSPEGTGGAVPARSHASHSPSLPSSPGPQALMPFLTEPLDRLSCLSLEPQQWPVHLP